MYCLIIFYTCYGTHRFPDSFFFYYDVQLRRPCTPLSFLVFPICYFSLQQPGRGIRLSSRFCFFFDSIPQYSSTVGGLPFVYILKGVDGRNKVMVDYSVLLLLFSSHTLFA